MDIERFSCPNTACSDYGKVGGGNITLYTRYGRKQVRLDGMKEHVKIQATLPCGWADHIWIHKQASLKEMNLEQPLYLMDDGTQPIPPLFYPMLNKCLVLPLLPEWVGYWQMASAGKTAVCASSFPCLMMAKARAMRPGEC